MLNDFMIRAALAGFGVALAAGVLGVFVVWRRMAYYGDATAHAAILGVALALGFALPVTAGVFAVAIVAALAVHLLAGRQAAGDTILGVIAHGALALGLVAMALVPGGRRDLDSFLFGDVLTVSAGHVGLIWLGAVAIIAVLVWRWSKLLTATVSPELAHASGINPSREGLVLMILVSALVALAIKVTGALLVTALLVVPAAAARPLARSPEGMAVLAATVGIISVALGLWLAWVLNVPAGPAVVAVAAGFFVLTRAGSAFSRG